MLRGALASRYGISPLGRGVIRPASGGWWLSGGIAAANCIAAYQPKGAADYAASKVNLANPGTYNAEAGSDPSFNTSYGWLFDVNTKNLVLAPVNCSSGTMIIRTAKYQNASGIILGWTTAQTGWSGNDFQIRVDYQWNTCQFKVGTTSLSGSYSSTNTDVVHCISTNCGYINGTKTNYSVTGAGSVSGNAILNNSKLLFYAKAVSIYNIALTDTQVAAVSTAMAAL